MAGYLHHLKGLLHNTDNSETVLPLLAEFQSHRVHMSTLLQTLQPNIITRWLLLILQVRKDLSGTPDDQSHSRLPADHGGWLPVT